MKFIIIEVERLARLGIDSKDFRKTTDGTLAILHQEFLRPVTETSTLKGYEHDSPELTDLLASAEWSELPEPSCLQEDIR